MNYDHLSTHLASGISHHGLRAISRTCTEILTTPQSDPGSIQIFVIGSICADIAEYLDSISPIDTATHARINDIITPHLIHAMTLDYEVDDISQFVLVLQNLIIETQYIIK